MNIEETHTFLEYKIKTARENKRLTPQARQADLARAYHTAKTNADALLRDAEAQVTRQKRDLKRKAFVTSNGKADPSAAISRRDASDRAAMVTDPQEAVRLLRRAHDNGDDDLAAAIAQHAHDQAAMVSKISKHGGSDPKNMWQQVVAEYAQERPAARTALEELQQIPNFNDPAQRFRITARYTLAKPAELENLSDHQIAMLAESDLAAGDE